MEREGVRGGLRAVSGWCGFVWCLRAGWDGYYYYTGSVGMARAGTGENFGRVTDRVGGEIGGMVLGDRRWMAASLG